MTKIGVYRIVGAELPPRDVVGTRERVSRYILTQESLSRCDDCHYHWIMNQIGKQDLRRRLHQLFDDYAARVTDFPLSYEAVIQAATFEAKVLQAIRINSARNYAILDGRARGYDWTIVLDGDCMFTEEGFEQFLAVARTTDKQYIGIPSRRSVVYSDGTVESVGDLGEPMLAFSKHATRMFDERLAFGQGDKLRFLIELGFSPKEGTHAQLLPGAAAAVGGWVDHISLDVAADLAERSRPVREAVRMAGLRDYIAWIESPQPRNLYSAFNVGWKGIDGFFDFEGPYSGIAADVPDGYPIVEVGSWLGKSALYLARELELRGKTNQVYCVDTWQGEPDLQGQVASRGGKGGMLEQFLYNTRHHAGRILPLPVGSQRATDMFKDESVMCVFIDANHTYDAVTHDLQAWYPKVKPGGMICGHDYVPTHPNSINDVVAAVDTFFEDKPLELRPYSRVWKHVKRSRGPRIWS